MPLPLICLIVFSVVALFAIPIYFDQRSLTKERLARQRERRDLSKPRHVIANQPVAEAGSSRTNASSPALHVFQTERAYAEARETAERVLTPIEMDYWSRGHKPAAGA